MVDLDEVERMKNLGMSNREIASRLGVPLSTLKYYLYKRQPDVTYCQHCGKEIIGRKRKFCDKHCRWRYKLKKPRFCKFCGKPIEQPKRGYRLFCSAKCQEYNKRLEQAKWKGVVWRHIEKEMENEKGNTKNN